MTAVGPGPSVYGLTGEVGTRHGNRSTNNAPRNAYETSDGHWVAISTSAQAIAERVLVLVGHPEVIDEPWFASGHTRAQHADLLDEYVGGWIAVRTRDEVVTAFTEAGAAVAPVYSARDLVEDEHVRATQMLTEVDDPALGDGHPAQRDVADVGDARADPLRRPLDRRRHRRRTRRARHRRRRTRSPAHARRSSDDRPDCQLLDAVRSGLRVVDLGRTLTVGMPQSPNHPAYWHAHPRRHGDMVRADGGSAANDIITMGTHVGTHVDALSHVSQDGKLYGGLDATEALQGGRYVELGAHTIEPMVRRGVLLDVPGDPRRRAARGRPGDHRRRPRGHRRAPGRRRSAPATSCWSAAAGASTSTRATTTPSAA